LGCMWAKVMMSQNHKNDDDDDGYRWYVLLMLVVFIIRDALMKLGRGGGGLADYSTV
jgi:hypothetical protein